MGEASFSQVCQEFDRRKQAGEFRTVDHGSKHEGQQFTTATMAKMEREILAHVEKGNPAGAVHRSQGAILVSQRSQIAMTGLTVRLL